MPETDVPRTNHILRALNEEDWLRVREVLTPVELKHGAVVYEAETEIQNLVFVQTGMISLVSTTHTGLIVETGLAGPEGVAGISLLHGVSVSYDRGIVQIPGKGHALDAIMLPALLHSCPTLREAMHRFAYGLSALTAYASACNRRHPVEQRLARWLLLVHDRVGEPLLSLTHNFIAQMLGVRRSSVTIFAEKLRSAGLIDYTRGNVRIVNRAGLERATCDCYAAIQRAFATAGLPNSLATLTPSAVAMARPGRSSVST